MSYRGEALGQRVVSRRECRAGGREELLFPGRRKRDPVLYVPGFIRFYISSTAIRRRLRNLDFEIYTLRMPNFNAGDVRWGGRILLGKVEELRVLLGAKRVSVIGQGLGGLVARTMAEQLGGAPFLSKLIMLGTPNHGSFTFYLFFPFQAARQAWPGSSFLESLSRAYEETWRGDGSPYYSIYTNLDAAIVPWTRCRLEGAENIRLGWPCTHMGMVRSRAVALLLAKLLEGEADEDDRRRAEEDRESLQELNLILEEDPMDDAALLRRARILLEWGYYREAINDLNRVIKLRPDLPEAFLLRGRAYRHKIQYEDNPLYSPAIRDYSQAIRLEPSSAEAYHERGVCYALLNSWGEAMEDWDRALILNRDFFPAYLARGMARRKRGDVEGAKEDFREVLRVNPEEPDALRFLSELE